MSASPMGVPGWPLLAFSTASIERPLMVLTASWICWGLYSRGMANLLQQDRVDRSATIALLAPSVSRVQPAGGRCISVEPERGRRRGEEPYSRLSIGHLLRCVIKPAA